MPRASTPRYRHGRGDAADPAATPDADTPPEQPRQPGQPPRPVMLAAGLCLLAGAAGFAALMAADPAAMALDRWWLSQVTGWQATGLARAGEMLSYVGGPWGGTAVVAIIVAALLYARRFRTAVFLALAEACGSGASQLVKHLVVRPRPPDPLVRADFGSFPSGHVITTVVVGLALVAALARPGHRRLSLAIVAAATVVMMCCRTYLRAHWLTDTFESVALASGIVLALWWWFAPALARERDTVPRITARPWPRGRYRRRGR